MTLGEVLLTALQAPEAPIKPSRRGPLQTSVRHYAALLGVDAAHCPPELYHLPDARLSELIDTKAPAHFAPRTRRNLKNDLRWLLRLAVQRGWIAPLPESLQSYRTRRRTPRGFHPARHEGTNYTPYGLNPLAIRAPMLAADLDAYLRWCETGRRPQDRSRGTDRLPRAIRKRPITSLNTRRVIAALAGYAVSVYGLPADTLSLHELTSPALVGAYADWWATERRGLVTATLIRILGQVRAIATHWLRNSEHADGIAAIMQELEYPSPVRNKQERWLSLAEIASVADSIHPFNERRLRESRHARRLARHVADPSHDPAFARFNLRPIAWRVQARLLLRLLMEWPWRQRNFREMRLGRHLVKDRDGRWRMSFHGHELKISHRGTRENVLEGFISSENHALMEEWLSTWRPRLVPPNSDLVFVNYYGHPFTAGAFTRMVESVTYRFTGVAMTPHMIRDVWATEYLKAHPGDAATVAKRLGNTIQVVHRHYAHLLDADAEAKGSEWIRQHLI